MNTKKDKKMSSMRGRYQNDERAMYQVMKWDYEHGNLPDGKKKQYTELHTKYSQRGAA